jgi:hypothetical protein
MLKQKVEHYKKKNYNNHIHLSTLGICAPLERGGDTSSDE